MYNQKLSVPLKSIVGFGHPFHFIMTTKQKIIKFIINAIKDIQQTLDAGNYQAGQYTDIARGMVRGVSLYTAGSRAV